MPLRSDSSPAMDNSEPNNTELEMRRALGLDRDSPGSFRPAHPSRPAERHMPDGQKRRFVQDGEVPVFVMQGRRGSGGQIEPRLASNSSPVNRLEVAETALRTEREAREKAERILGEAQASVRELQTALGHAVLARDEARHAAQRAEVEKQQAEAALASETEARELAETATRQAEAKFEAAEQSLVELKRVKKIARVAAIRPEPELPLAPPVAAPVARKRAVAKAAVAPRKREPEPKPVKWWIKPRVKKAK